MVLPYRLKKWFPLCKMCFAIFDKLYTCLHHFGKGCVGKPMNNTTTAPILHGILHFSFAWFRLKEILDPLDQVLGIPIEAHLVVFKWNVAIKLHWQLACDFFHVPQPAGSSAASPSSFFGYCDPTQQRQEEIHPHPHGKTSADGHGRRAVYTALPCCKVCVANLHSDDGKVASDPGVSHFRLYGRCFFAQGLEF